MRLICPNCDAEYEVDGSLLPHKGRDVQCSNCTTTWFQPGPNHDPEPQPEVSPPPVQPTEDPKPSSQADTQGDADLAPNADAATIVAPGLKPRKPIVDPAAMDVIHEEVALETAAREVERGGVETQPDLGLDDTHAEARAKAARNRIVRKRSNETHPDITEDAIADLEADLEADLDPDELHTKKELFPDIEEINSTLSPEVAEAEAKAARLAEEGGDTIQTQRSSFRLGFGLMLLVAVGLLLLYAYAPQIIQSVPALAGPLESYVSLVDSGRVWLDTLVQGVVEDIGTTVNEQPES